MSAYAAADGDRAELARRLNEMHHRRDLLSPLGPSPWRLTGPGEPARDRSADRLTGHVTGQLDRPALPVTGQQAVTGAEESLTGQGDGPAAAPAPEPVTVASATPVTHDVTGHTPPMTSADAGRKALTDAGQQPPVRPAGRGRVQSTGHGDRTPVTAVTAAADTRRPVTVTGQVSDMVTAPVPVDRSPARLADRWPGEHADVYRLTEHLLTGRELTNAEAGQLLGASESTGGRRLRRARELTKQVTRGSAASGQRGRPLHVVATQD